MAKKRTTQIEAAPEPQRPDPFRYHDYKSYLKDWLAYKKATQPGFSIRWLAIHADFAVGYLSTVLSGARHISMKSFAKLTPLMELTHAEQSYLENLVRLATLPSPEGRVGALERMNAFTSFQRRNPNEARVIKYWSRWYYVVIREMAAAPGFKMDAEWIQPRLKSHVSLTEIREALEFLTKQNFLEVKDDGSVTVTEKHLECVGPVFRNALSAFHKQMFGLAMQSIDQTPGTERSLTGHTINIAPEQYNEAKRILDEALDRIQNLPEKGKAGENIVYHVELAIFPMTKRGEQ